MILPGLMKKLETGYKLNYLTIAFLVFLAISLRLILERIFFEWYFPLDYYYGMVLVERFAFLIFTFSVSTLLLSYLSKAGVEKTLNFLSKTYFLITIPPLIDHFIFGKASPYSYITLEGWVNSLSSFFITYQGLFGTDFIPGIFIEFILISFFFSLFVFYNSKSAPRALVVFPLILGLFSFLGSLWIEILVPDLTKMHEYYAVKNLGIDFYVRFYVDLFKRKLAFIYLSLSAVILFFNAYRINKKAVGNILKNTRPFRAFFFILMSMGGILLSGSFVILNAISAALSVFFVWEFTIVMNDLSDEKIDKRHSRHRPLIGGKVKRLDYMTLGIFYAVLCMAFSFITGPGPFLLICLCVLLGILYSFKPVRIRNFIFSTSVLGLASVVCFLIGYLSGYGTLSQGIMLVCFIIFLVSSLLTTVKDIKDYSGDKKEGVRNIFTVFGKKKGKNIASVNLLVSFLLPLVVINRAVDFIFLFVLSFIALRDFKKKESVRRTVIFSFVLFIYFFIRLYFYIHLF